MFQQSEMCVRASVRNWKKAKKQQINSAKQRFIQKFLELQHVDEYFVELSGCASDGQSCKPWLWRCENNVLWLLLLRRWLNVCMLVWLLLFYVYIMLSPNTLYGERESSLCVCVRRMFQSGYEYCSSIASGLSWFFCIEPNRCFSGLSRYFSAFYVEFSVVSFNLLDSLDPILVLWIV